MPKLPAGTRRWLLLCGLNLLLDLLLWFFISTDYSLTGTIPDLLLPSFVVIVAICSWVAALSLRDSDQKSALRITALPGLVGALLLIIPPILFFVPPFTLAGMFVTSEILAEEHIQDVPSPDGSRVASIYFRPVGAYSSANGLLVVRVHSPWLPFVERDIYQGDTYLGGDALNDAVTWQDDDTIKIADSRDNLKLDWVRPEPPGFGSPVGLLQLGWQLWGPKY